MVISVDFLFVFQKADTKGSLEEKKG